VVALVVPVPVVSVRRAKLNRVRKAQQFPPLLRLLICKDAVIYDISFIFREICS